MVKNECTKIELTTHFENCRFKNILLSSICRNVEIDDYNKRRMLNGESYRAKGIFISLPGVMSFLTIQIQNEKIVVIDNRTWHKNPVFSLEIREKLMSTSFFRKKSIEKQVRSIIKMI